MNEFTEVTAENLRFIRGAKGMNQEEIGELLGLPKTGISNIERGVRALSESEKALLDWFFFEKLPPRLTNTLDLKGCLEFSLEEWNIIENTARRRGMKPAEYIVDVIRDYLAHRGILQKETSYKAPTVLKVAEEETPYRTDGNGNNNHGTSGKA